MTSSLKLLAAILTGALAAGCIGPSNKHWSQFHADGANQGFLAVHSGVAFNPAWSRQLGKVFHSSPSIGDDGTILVGGTGGTLFAVNQDNTFKCSADLPQGAILSSPSIDLHGNVYVVTTDKVDDRFRSVLHSVDSDCQLNWSFTFPSASPQIPGHTTSSAKTWARGGDVYIFVPAQLTKQCDFDCNDPEDGFNELFVLNLRGSLIAREPVGGCITLGGGGGSGGGNANATPSSLLDDAWASLTQTGLVVGQPPGTPLHEQVGWLDPTVAVVDYPGITRSGNPIIVVANYCLGLRLTAFRWNPVGSNSGTLVRLWTHEDQSDRFLYSSPAVFPNGLIVLGRGDGLVQAFDVQTGDKLWDYDAGEPVLATPASIGRQIYVASETHLHVLEPNGALVDVSRLFGGHTIASPALTADRVYVSTTIGTVTYSFDLSSVALDIKSPGGMASPAVGDDGTIYVMKETGNGQSLLRAYPAP